MNLILISIFSDGVRLREGHRQRDPKSYSSRRSSTDSSEEGFNLNLRDLKVGKIKSKVRINRHIKLHTIPFKLTGSIHVALQKSWNFD